MLVFRCGEGQHRGEIWYRNKTTAKAGLLCIIGILVSSGQFVKFCLLFSIYSPPNMPRNIIL